jgi:hypothetical protein
LGVAGIKRFKDRDGPDMKVIYKNSITIENDALDSRFQIASTISNSVANR